MFIHIGGNDVIQSKDIIAIVDRNVVSSSVIMEEMVSRGEAEGIVSGPLENAKSIVITTDHIYCSTLSAATLQKRASMIQTISRLEDSSEELDLD